MKKIFTSLFAAAALLGAGTAGAQSIFNNKPVATNKYAHMPSAKEGIVHLWQPLALNQAPSKSLMRSQPTTYLVYTLNEAALKAQLFNLSENPGEGVVVSLPMPDGTMRDFKVWQSAIMPEELANQYPEIKTYTGEAVNDKRVTAKLDFTLFGFHAMVFESGNTSFVDPYDNLHDGYYMVHYKQHELRTMVQRMKCGVLSPNDHAPGAGEEMEIMQQGLPKLDMTKTKFEGYKTSSTPAAAAAPHTAARTANGFNLRTYRIAVSANHEYCQAATGLATPTIAQALSAMTTTMNRVNGVYNREFSVQMNFVAAETTIIWPTVTGSINGTDPFNGFNTNPSALLSLNQTTCDARIGNTNYDIGHIFTTGGGGLASLGVVCNASFKAQGVTGSSSPTGDGYDIDYVAHEIGHEFGSGHTFANNLDGSCTGNYDASHAYEPGSGATIMDYAGICNPDDLQPHSDPYFSASSVLQIVAQLNGSENVCAVSTATGNDSTHLAGFTATYNIPYKTPFELTGPTGTLISADTAVTYSWYQWNLGTGVEAGVRLNQTFVTGPIFRSFQPVYTPYRVFPKLSLILNGTLSDVGTEGNEGEKAPDTARYLTFKMNVRSILNGKGVIDMPDDSVHINALATGAGNLYRGFRVTSQATAVTYAGNSAQTVTWNAVGTTGAPYNVMNVDIYVSTNGALTWTLLGNYPNSGTASVTLPNPATTSATCRIKVKGSGNIFFNINGANFTITHVVVPVVGPINGIFSICAGSSTTLTDTSVSGTWSSSNTGVATIGLTTGVLTGVAAGTATITYTAPAGFVTQVITVNALPVAGSVTGASSLCVGQSTTLTNTTGTPGGTWSSSNTSRATVTAGGIVTAVAAGNVNITYTAANSCGSATAVKAMTINAIPVVAAITGTTFNLCAGSSTILTDASPLGVWSSTATGVATITSAGLVNAVSAGTTTISYTITNSSGCVAAATAVFTVNAIPVATTSPSGTVTICTGSDIVLNALPGTGAFTYRWQESSIDIPGATNVTYTASTAGNYRVLITSAAGCTGTSAAVTVIVSSSTVVVPSVSLSASPGTTICTAGTSVTYTATPVNGGSAPTYSWTINGVSTGTSGPTYTYAPVNGDVVAVTLTSSSPCASPTTASASVTMTVGGTVTPTVGIATAPNDTVCTGSGVTYNAIPVFGGTAPTYQWSVNGTNVATGASFSTTPTNGDVVIVTMTSNYTTCLTSATVASAPFTMTVLAPQTNTVSISATSLSTTVGGAVTFVAIAPYGGASPAYQWFINTTAVPGATNVTFTTTALTNGDIVYCKETTSQLCVTPYTALSSGLTILVTSGVWETTTSGSSFVLLPNPNKGTFTIKGKTASGSDKQVSVVVSNMLGQTIYKASTMAGNGDVNLPVTLTNALPNGTYFVNVIAGGENVVFHVVIDK